MVSNYPPIQVQLSKYPSRHILAVLSVFSCRINPLKRNSWAKGPRSFTTLLKKQGHLGNHLKPDLAFENSLSMWWLENKHISRTALLMGLFTLYPTRRPKMIPFWLIFMGDNVFLPPGTSFYFTTAITSTYKSSDLGYLKTFPLLTSLRKTRTRDRIGK